jgi:hypothetical protein
MREIGYWSHPIPFTKMGQELKKIFLPFNLVLFHQKNSQSCKKKLRRSPEWTASEWKLTIYVVFE